MNPTCKRGQYRTIRRRACSWLDLRTFCFRPRKTMFPFCIPTDTRCPPCNRCTLRSHKPEHCCSHIYCRCLRCPRPHRPSSRWRTRIYPLCKPCLVGCNRLPRRSHCTRLLCKPCPRHKRPTRRQLVYPCPCTLDHLCKFAHLDGRGSLACRLCRPHILCKRRSSTPFSRPHLRTCVHWVRCWIQDTQLFRYCT